MKQHGTYLVPTLYLSDWFLENAAKTGVPPSMLAKGKEVMPAARKNVAHAFASGVKVGFGTDAAVYPHGLNAHEFAVMVKLGLTPLQAIQAATVNDADLLGLSDKVGTIEPGQFADIIAVDGDPLEDVTTLERVKFVMKDGVVYKSEREFKCPKPRFGVSHVDGGVIRGLRVMLYLESPGSRALIERVRSGFRPGLRKRLGSASRELRVRVGPTPTL